MNTGFHYNQTYTPVQACDYIWMMLSTLICNNWKTIQIDYVLDFTPAPDERGYYMNIPKGIKLYIEINCVIKAKKNIYR